MKKKDHLVSDENQSAPSRREFYEYINEARYKKIDKHQKDLVSKAINNATKGLN